MDAAQRSRRIDMHRRHHGSASARPALRAARGTPCGSAASGARRAGALTASGAMFHATAVTRSIRAVAAAVNEGSAKGERVAMAVIVSIGRAQWND
jgi:hypothetical protein